MASITVALAITAETAVSIGAAGSASSLADRAVVRDGAGRPLIPGSQIKGKLRYAAEQLLRSLGAEVASPFVAEPDAAANPAIEAIFGSPRAASPLRFADLVCDLTPAAAALPGVVSIRPSVMIDRQRGTAADQHLLLQEVVREKLVFRSEAAIAGRLEHVEHAALLWASLHLTERWGGAKSRGLGWCSIETSVHWNGGPLSPVELAAALRGLEIRS